MSQKREAAIVGIHEYPLRVVGSGTSALQIKAASAARALEDAGIYQFNIPIENGEEEHMIAFYANSVIPNFRE